MTSPTSNYWLDLAARDISAQYPAGLITVSSGISPSASYHIGHFREIMTADALVWALRRDGREACHVHVVDNFDPLRKRYDFLPPEYEQYVGWPICLVPDPFEMCRSEHGTYAEHFYREFEHYARQMGIRPDKVVRSYEDLYASGRMTHAIERSLDSLPAIRSIFERISHRILPEVWLPLQLLGPNKSFTELTYESIDPQLHTIRASDTTGAVYELDYASGMVKLNWRLDWPARWSVLGVQVEPFSAQEHGAAGGSYDTGVAFAQDVFGVSAPIPGVRYANIHMLGDTKKMSSSKNNLVTPAQALSIMPPEVLRYFIVRSRPERTLFWDSGQGLFELIREFGLTRAEVEAGKHPEFAEAYTFAVSLPDAVTPTITTILFDHLVQVFQAARGDVDEAVRILTRTGYESHVRSAEAEVRAELTYVAEWLEHYAPENMKFMVQDILPTISLEPDQTLFLDTLATTIEDGRNLDGDQMHQAIYMARETAGITPAAAFKLLYEIILNRSSGPKAGWFLASLDPSWLVRRLRREG